MLIYDLDPIQGQDQGVTWGLVGDAPQLGGFAIGARVALLWQQREREILASTCLYLLYLFIYY